MLVSLKQTGGFAGGSFDLGSLDTEELGPSGEHLRQLLEAARFFELPDQLVTTIGADLVQYELTVKDGGREHAVRFTSGAAPETAVLAEIVKAFQSKAG